MQNLVLSRALIRWSACCLLGIVPGLVGCCGAQRFACDMQGLFRCGTNCDSCGPKLFPPRSPEDECNECLPCGSKYPGLFNSLGFCCKDPRIARAKERVGHGRHGRHGRQGDYEPYHPDNPLSPWSHDGPGNFQPVPTRPVYGPQPTPADPLPHSDEDPSDAGLESIPLRDMPRNLDSPSDPRNLIPADEDVEPNPVDFPPDASGSVLKKYPVQQTGWRARTK